MKKSIKLSLAFATLLSLMLFTLILSCVFSSLRIAYATNDVPLEELIVNTSNYYYSNEQFTIYGNYSSFDRSELNNIISNQSKIHIFYDNNLTDNTTSAVPVLSNNACIYYYKNNVRHIDTYLSNDTDSESCFSEIKEYITCKINKIYSETAVCDSNSQIFSTIYSGTMRHNEKPYGYIDIDWAVKKYRASDISSLYIVESHAAFTPGIVAMANDSSGYLAWKNLSGYLHVTPRIAQFDVGYGQTRYGGTPVFKDAYPINNPGTITIASTYNIGATLGYSFKNGFSLDNISVGEGKDLGLNISYSYNKSYTTTEPALSAQKNASNPQAYEWLYTYNSARSETNHLITGYMFEMNNKGHDLFEGDLSFRYDYKMTVKHNNNTQSFSHYRIVEYT